MINLHGHTSASDGLGSTELIVQTAVRQGQTALAITDHGTVGGWLEFWRLCNKHGIKPILGVEAYVEFGNNEVGHMTLLAKNIKGVESIIELQNIGHLSARKQPAIGLKDLVKHKEGVIVLSGCPSSPINRGDDYVKEEFIKTLVAAYGNDFYIEMTFTMPNSWKTPMDMSSRYGVPVVVTTDFHFPTEGDAELHRKVNKFRKGYDFPNKDLWIMGDDDIKRLANEHGFPHPIKDYIVVTHQIARKIEHIEFDYVVDLPAPHNAREIVMEVARQAIPKIKTWDKRYGQRFMHEHDVIKKLKYFEYFWMVMETVNWARKQGIHIGHGRGSAAGSLILFMLGITNVDPIKHDLIFERFLNESRGDYPDIDIDFQDSRRDEVIEYVSERWKAVPIATTSRWKHKSLVHDLCKMLLIPRSTGDKAAENKESPEFLTLMTNEEFAHGYHTCLGQIRHLGKHASGFVISGGRYPLERQKDGSLAVPFSTGGYGDDLTPFGLVKFDFLGLSSLSARARMEELSGFKPAPFGEDAKTLALLQSGNLNGVFQLSSPGMQRIVQSIAPKNGTDIAIALALFRPGPLGSGLAFQYGDLVKTPRKVHPLIDAVLEETGGMMIFQEQLMRVFSVMTGLPDTETDKMRKLVGKKLVTDPLWITYRDKFINGCIDAGMTMMAAEEFWGEVEVFGEYAFNKAHSVSYAMLSWDTAFYKANYQVAFWAAMLEHDPVNRFMYLMDMAKDGVGMVPAHINVSSTSFEISRKGVVFPINAVKGVGRIAEMYIINERNANGEYTSVKDFCNRVPKAKVNKGVKRALYAMGAFEGFRDLENLGLTTDELSDVASMSQRERELKYFGFAFPTLKMIEALNTTNQSDSQSIGMVVFEKKGSSHKGPYHMLVLYPERRFFFPKPVDASLGQVVKVRHNKWGKAHASEVLG